MGVWIQVILFLLSNWREIYDLIKAILDLFNDIKDPNTKSDLENTGPSLMEKLARLEELLRPLGDRLSKVKNLRLKPNKLR